MNDTVWIPAVPLPLMGWRHDRCVCGEKFRGRNRRHEYEIHYRRVHEGPTSPAAMMGISREEAIAIYDEVANARG